MKKLELKYLAPYLSHNVTVYVNDLKDINAKPIHKLHTNEGVGSINHMLTSDRYRLVLRPLSDFTKEIEVNGERFVPIIELFQLIDGGSYTEDRVLIKNEKGLFVISNSISQLSFNSKENYFDYKTFDFDGEDWQPSFNQLELFNKLFEWHFDVFGLIEAGLAIDINTLEL